MLLICVTDMCGTWIRIFYVLCSKTYSTFGSLFWFPAGSQRGTRICETRLLTDNFMGISYEISLRWNTLVTS